MNSRIKTPQTTKATTCETNAEQILRDLAFVLRMSRKLKSELLSERAFAQAQPQSVSSQLEPPAWAI